MRAPPKDERTELRNKFEEELRCVTENFEKDFDKLNSKNCLKRSEKADI
jgi:hypothetical protein